MTLENQVCSLDLAKRLKELGLKQKSLFWHRVDKDNYQESLVIDEKFESDRFDFYSAFTVAELGKMLPWIIEKNGKTLWLEMGKNGPKPAIGKIYTICYAEPQVEDETIEILPWPNISEDTEADARAKMLIYLLENKLITLSLCEQSNLDIFGNLKMGEGLKLSIKL